MLNRFKFVDNSFIGGRTRHCVVVEVTKARNGRVVVVTENSKVFRVPLEKLVHVPEGSPIKEEDVEALVRVGVDLLAGKRAADRARREKRVELEERLRELLGSF